MTTTDTLQIAGAGTALVLQGYSMWLTHGVRRLVPRRLFWFLNSLMYFEFIRRVLTLLLVLHLTGGESYESYSVAFGLLISASLLTVVLGMHKHARNRDNEMTNLAKATVHLAHGANAENSLAYQLAVHFIRQRELRDASKL